MNDLSGVTGVGVGGAGRTGCARYVTPMLYQGRSTTVRGVLLAVCAAVLTGSVVAQTPPTYVAPQGTHEWLPSLPLTTVQSYSTGMPTANGGVVTTSNPGIGLHPDSGLYLTGNDPMVVSESDPSKSVLNLSGSRGGWRWGNVVPPAIMANYRSKYMAPWSDGIVSNFGVKPDRHWVLNRDGELTDPASFLGNSGFHFPYGSRLNIDLENVFPTGDLLPIGPTIDSNTLAMVPAGAGASPAGWKGQARAVIDGSIDLMTGRPIVRVTDLTIPFGTTSFNLHRSRSSIVERFPPATSTDGGTITRTELNAPSYRGDRWWDWTGNGWMISENPLFVLDCTDPRLVGAKTPPTSWLMLDAHQSIPFQQIEGVALNGQARYEGLPRLGATLEVFGGVMGHIDIRTGLEPLLIQDVPPTALRWGWRQEPTMAKVTLHNGALTYWFAIIPKTFTATNGERLIGGLTPPMKWDPEFLNPGEFQFAYEAIAGATEPFPWLRRPWTATDATERPIDPQALRTLYGSNGQLPLHWADHSHWGNYGTGDPAVGRTGLGVPRLGLLTKIEDRHGNEVHIEYVNTRTWRMDDERTVEAIEFLQDGPSIGQIKAVHLVGPRRTDDGSVSSEKTLQWTLLYVHRATPGIIHAANRLERRDDSEDTHEMESRRVFEDGPEIERLIAHGKRAIDRVWAFRGGLPRSVLNSLGADKLTIDPRDASGFLGDAAEVLYLASVLEAANVPAWEHEVRYQYDLFNPVASSESVPPDANDSYLWTKHAFNAQNVASEPILAKTVVTSRAKQVGLGELGDETKKSRIFLYSAPIGSTSASANRLQDVLRQNDGNGDAVSGWGSGSVDRSPPWHHWLWLDGILEQSDIDAIERDMNTDGRADFWRVNQRQVTWEEIALWRKAATEGGEAGNFTQLDQYGSVGLWERVRRFASKRFDPLNVVNDLFGAENPVSNVVPRLSQLRRSFSSGGGSFFSAGSYIDRVRPDLGAGLLWSSSLRDGKIERHYRVHRFMVVPPSQGNALFGTAPWETAFVNPFWWHGYSSNPTGLTDEATKAPENLREPRFVAIVDEFSNRNAMMNLPAVQGAATVEGGWDIGDQIPSDYNSFASPTGVWDDPNGASPNGFAILPDQRSRRVVEINAWGFVLRERKWEFDKSGQIASTSSKGIGEDYVYRTVGEVFPDIQAMAVPPPSGVVDTRDPRTVAFSKELLLVEKRTVGHSVAENIDKGESQGLIELYLYNRFDRPGPGEVSLDIAPWSSRIQQVATAIGKGSVTSNSGGTQSTWTGRVPGDGESLPGNVRLMSQRFFKPTSPWSMTGEVRFLSPRTALLPLLPKRPGTGNSQTNPDFAAPNSSFSTTWTEVEYYPQDSGQNSTVPITAWRTIGERVIHQPRRTRPGGPWLFPFTASIDNGAGEKTITVTGLVADPENAQRLRGADETVVVTWQSQSQMPWATVVDADLTPVQSGAEPSLDGRMKQADVSRGPADGASDEFDAIGYWPAGVPASWRWTPNRQQEGVPSRKPLALTTITEWANYEPMDQWTQSRAASAEPDDRGELRRRVVRHVVVKNVLSSPTPTDPNATTDNQEDDRLVEFIFESLVPVAGETDRRNGTFTTQSEGEVRVYAGGSKRSPVERTFKVTWRNPVGPNSNHFAFGAWPTTSESASSIELFLSNLWTSGVTIASSGGTPPMISAYRKAEKKLALDSFGRPQKLEELGLVSIDGNPPIWGVVGRKLVNDLGEVYRENELGGNITRQTRNTIGQVLRKYVGSRDGKWGLVGTMEDPTSGPALPPHDMTLREAYVYGSAPNDIYQRTHVWRYRKSPAWANAAYYDDPGTAATSKQLMGAHAALTKSSYDWRGRAVRVDEYDFAGAVAESNGGAARRLRTTLTYLDHAGRTLMVATYGENIPASLVDVPTGSAPTGSLDPTHFGVDGYAPSEQAPTPRALLSLSPRPISLVRYVLNTDGHAEETRTYDLMAGVGAGTDDPPYQSEFRYVGFAGKEVFSASPNGPDRRTQLDGLGRAERVRSVVPGTDRELERTEYTYDPDGRVTVEKRFERVPSSSSDAANILVAANSVETQVWTWYDTVGRVLARADLGRGGNTDSTSPTYSPGGTFGATGTRDRIYAGPLLANATDNIVHEADALRIAGDGAKVTVNGYDLHGRLAQVREPNGKRTATYYVGETDRVARVLENFGEVTDKQRETSYQYALRRLVRVRTGAPLISFGDPGSAEVFVEYGADVVDATYTRVSTDMTAIGAVYDDERESRVLGSAQSNIFVNRVPKARLRYFLDGKLAERIDGRGIALRYSYDGIGRLIEVNAAVYPTPWQTGDQSQVESYTSAHASQAGGEMLARVQIEHVDDERLGIGWSRQSITASSKFSLGDNFRSSKVWLDSDANGRLVMDRQVHGSGVMSTESPTVRYVWDRLNASGAVAGYTRLQRMLVEKLTFAAGREFDYIYGTAGSGDDNALSRLTFIQTSIDDGTPRSVAEFSYAGVDRRISTVQGPHYNSSTFDSKWTVDTDGNSVGLEGLDRFGRQTDLHYANSSGDTHFRQQMGYDPGDQRLFSRVTQAAEPPVGGGGSPWSLQENTRSSLYAYDLLGRLIKSETGELSPAQPNAPPYSVSSMIRSDIWTLDAVGNWGTGNHGDRKGRESVGNLDLYGTPWQTSTADPSDNTSVVSDETDQTSRITSRLVVGADRHEETQGYIYDLAGNLVYDGQYVYTYDAWSRLVAVSLDGGEESDEQTAYVVPRRAGHLVKHFAYDGLGRLIRTLSPFPNVAVANAMPDGPVYRSERFYYDGQRRIAEVVVDPVASIAAAIASEDQELLGIASIPGAIIGGEGDRKGAPLWFEGLQIGSGQLAEPPVAYISREYLWGPGDRGPDELLTMFAWDGTGSAASHNARPPNTLWSVITDASGDCVGLVTEATVGRDAEVAWQATYEPYGTLIDSRSIVPHPHLKAGHKGLFAERLDGGVVTGMLGVDRGRLEPGATLLYHNRNRTFSPTLGRFLQSDPNASGLAVIGSVSYAGSRAMVDVMGADLSAMTGDGVGLYQYVGGNPVRGNDPTGLWLNTLLQVGTDALLTGVRGVRGGLESMTFQYAQNLEDDIDWAMDWSQPDDWNSRMSSEWVYESFEEGMSGGFRDGINEAISNMTYGLWPTEGAESGQPVAANFTGIAGAARSTMRFTAASARAVARSHKLLLASARDIDLARAFKQLGYNLKGQTGRAHHFIDRLRGVGGDANRMARGGVRTVADVVRVLQNGTKKAGGFPGTEEITLGNVTIVWEPATRNLITIITSVR